MSLGIFGSGGALGGGSLGAYVSGGIFGESVDAIAVGGGAPAAAGPAAGSEEALLAAAAFTEAEVLALEAQELALRWELPSSRQTVTLGDTLYEVQITYRKRSSSWYLSLFSIDGSPIIAGRRLSPGWALNLASQGGLGPKGLLLVTGAGDPYRRDDLGTRLLITFYPRDGLKVPIPPAFSETTVVFE